MLDCHLPTQCLNFDKTIEKMKRIQCCMKIIYEMNMLSWVFLRQLIRKEQTNKFCKVFKNKFYFVQKYTFYDIWFWWSMYWLTSVTNSSFLICRELHCWGCGWFLLASVSSLGGIVLFMCGVYFPSSLHSSLLKHPENLSQALHQGKWFTHR